MRGMNIISCSKSLNLGGTHNSKISVSRADNRLCEDTVLRSQCDHDFFVFHIGCSIIKAGAIMLRRLFAPDVLVNPLYF